MSWIKPEKGDVIIGESVLFEVSINVENWGKNEGTVSAVSSVKLIKGKNA